MSRRLARWGVGLSLLIALPYLAGCTHWVALRTEPATYDYRKETRARLTLQDGRRVELSHPVVVDDSLLTERQPSPTAHGGTIDWREGVSPAPRVPLSDIRLVELSRPDGAATAVLIIGVGVAAFAVVAAIAAASLDLDFGGGGGGGGGGDYVGSCPLIDSWTGDGWVLDSGTFGGAIFPALTRTDVDNLPHATERAGQVRLRLRNRAPETEYVDALALLAVDHDPGVDVAPTGEGALVTLGVPAAPRAAHDFRGVDALERVRAVDDLAWESSVSGRDPAVPADVRDGLELEFARPADPTQARLVLDGNSSAWAAKLMQVFVRLHGSDWATWTRRMEADSTAARALGRQFAAEGFLAVSVLTDRGWERQGTFLEAGPEVTKRQVLPLDLSRAVGDPVRVRLESAPLFWVIDRVALDSSAPASLVTRVLAPDRAVDARGVDLRPRLAEIDRSYYVMGFGDSAEVVFAAPPLEPGRARTYLARTNGWYRILGPDDGEPRTATLDRLGHEPLAISRIAVEELNRVLAPTR